MTEEAVCDFCGRAPLPAPVPTRVPAREPDQVVIRTNTTSRVTRATVTPGGFSQAFAEHATNKK